MPHHIGYCTNVHAGADLEQTQHNLQQYAVAVKNGYSPDNPMGIGLWLSANTARQLLADNQVDEFANWLDGQGLLPFTLNGFPYGNFHQAVVKHRVYEPTWYQPERLEYTLDLIEILDRILPPGVEGSISTLPICWREPAPSQDEIGLAAEQLCRIADRLAKLETSSGRLIHICIEPEPGCYLQRSEDIISFFNNHLLTSGDEQPIRRHIRVCHDICHAAVMFEPQDEVLRRFRAEGIHLGKVQVSSAVLADFGRIDPNQRAAAIRQLSEFAEDRYLHQTTIRDEAGREQFFDDLPLALQSVEEPHKLSSRWCIHFHVPVYLERFGLLGTSRQQIVDCVRAAADHPELSHFEVETYAWGVLPEELQQPKLAAGIARELDWFSGVLEQR